jgi:hypothetical protein
MGIILKREDIIVEGEPGKYFDTARLENDIKEILNKDAEGRIKVLYKMRLIAIFKPIKVGHFSPSEKPEEIFIEGEHPHINMQIHIDDAHDYCIANVDGTSPVWLSEYIVRYRQYHYRFYDHTRGEDCVLLKPGDMIKLTAVDNYRELHNVGCIVGSCSTDVIMLNIADPNLIRATNSRRYDGDVVTTIVLKADILGDENEVREFQIEKID